MNSGRRCLQLALLLMLAAFTTGKPAPASSEPVHGIAMHGQPSLPADFTSFPYVNPDAPKGGTLILGQSGTFDSLNPMIIKGVAAVGIRDFVVESLMARSLDEPFTLYGHIAQTVEVPPDRSAITFHIDPRAKFSDGQPITADDVIFSHALLKEHGTPNMRLYYRKAVRVERIDSHTVRFEFADGSDREMPLILGLMAVLPKHVVDPDTFETTSLKPPIGSGPYRIAKVDAGRSITYERNPDWWARDLPAMRGRFNFDEVRFEYFRDATSLFEAFKTGHISLRSEDDPGRWAEGYRFDAVDDGRIKLAEFDISIPAGMSALAFNTRRPMFADQRVRQALILLFDFEWANRNLYQGLNTRTQSYFERSTLSSHSRPADARELALLGSYTASIKPEILAGTFSFPVSDGSGHNRANAQAAMQLLRSAGYALSGNRLVHTASGRQLAFEIMTTTRAQERLLAVYTEALARLGIRATLRQVDSTQYQTRWRSFDFDMIQWTWPASLSPGNEQLNRWGTAAADIQGSFNIVGVKAPAADAMIHALLEAREREDFETAVRALDRVLLSGDYVIPLFHTRKQWVAYWSNLRYPARTSLYGYGVDTWWSDPAASSPR
jgi:peptide/nickel transport system substrate-binding protein